MQACMATLNFYQPEITGSRTMMSFCGELEVVSPRHCQDRHICLQSMQRSYCEKQGLGEELLASAQTCADPAGAPGLSCCDWFDGDFFQCKILCCFSYLGCVFE